MADDKPLERKLAAEAKADDVAAKGGKGGRATPSLVREKMLDYWERQSSSLTVEAMMLDSRAEELDEADRPEVLSLVPSPHGDVIELGAGIGRYTGALAKMCGSVVAVDFLATAIAENERLHGHLGNVTFMCADVTTLELPAEAADVVFSNWLLMYLVDDEVAAFSRRALRWVRPGGHVFYRESCRHPCGDRQQRGENPTVYREPEEYTKLFSNTRVTSESGEYRWELVRHHSVQAYEVLKGNPNQKLWVWRKVLSAGEGECERSE